MDLHRRVAWIHSDETKAGRGIAVPLNSDAVIALREQQGKHPVYCFTYPYRMEEVNGELVRHHRPVQSVNGKAWRNALARAGIKDFRWHDLRHTWASWHVQSGTSLYVLQELGSWQSAAMVRRYGHLSADHLAKDAEQIAAPRAVSTEWHKSGHTAKEGRATGT